MKNSLPRLILALGAVVLFGVAVTPAANEKESPPPKTDTKGANATPATTKPTTKTQIADLDQMLEQARAAIAARSGEQIKWQVISSGGTDGSSASYKLKGTAGQLTVGEGGSANYGLRHGYWQNFSGGGGTCCQGSMRGNVDDDPGDVIDISDLVYLVDYMFTGGPAPTCWPEANIDGIGSDDASGIDISDLVYLVDYMFTGGPPPPAC